MPAGSLSHGVKPGVGLNNFSAYYKYVRPEVATFLPHRYSTVLEVGCAEGDFRANLNNECEYWGIEPVPAAAEAAAKKLDRVLAGTYREVCEMLPNTYFDLVICNDVMEHMADHDAFLHSIKKKLKNNACLVGSVPNVRYLKNLFQLLVKKDWKYRNSGILDRTHLRFFTKKSLERLFRENGFTIEALQGINGLGEGPASIMRFLKQLVLRPFFLLLGRDVRFLQFAFRISCPDSPERLHQTMV